MIRLDATNRKLQIVLAGAVTANQLPVVACYSDKTTTAYTGSMQRAVTNNTTQVDIVSAPAASTVRDIDSLSVWNKDTAAATVTIFYDDNATDAEVIKVTLAAGDQLSYTHGNGWKVITSVGAMKTGDSPFDLLSALTAAEVSVTGTTTLTSSAFGRMHVCSGTSADYTVTLPPVSGNSGKIIGFRMASGLTKLVTLDGDGTEAIDGETTRVLWKNESAVLLCDGTAWTKIAGKSIPMLCTMYPAAALTVNDNTATKVPLDTTSSDNTGFLADPTTNKRINIKRKSLYFITATAYYNSGTQIANIVQARIHVNGSLASAAFNVLNAIAAANVAFVRAVFPVQMNAGDYTELYAYQTSVAAASRDLIVNSINNTSFSLAELVQW